MAKEITQITVTLRKQKICRAREPLTIALKLYRINGERNKGIEEAREKLAYQLLLKMRESNTRYTKD